KFKIKVSKERAIAVYEDIARGSEPELRFYAMVAASTAIAAFGLIMNSTAVVIGAMLVAPLMTPIFGIALALVRGDTSLFGRAIRAEIAGVILTVALAACFGIAIPQLEVTPEMLSRTSPNLLDLLVAVFAGFAGAYAMVDEHISPALPGVAIATAIVPPLANSGLCISLGAYYGALGSFLLFFANFLSILLVASGIFFASGMARGFESITKKDVFRRFGLATFGFLIVAAILSRGLYNMVQARHIKGSINNVLEEQLSNLPATELQKIVYHKHKDKIFVLAHVHASGDFQPSQVKLMENALGDELKTPVELFVRSTLTRDVSAIGATNQALTETLDGFFVSKKPSSRIKLIKQAEQKLREYLETQLGMYMEAINELEVDGRPVIVATIIGARKMSFEEIENLESKIRESTGNDKLDLLIRHVNLSIYSRWRKINYGWTTFRHFTPDQEMVFKKIKDFLKTEFDKNEYFLGNFDLSIREGIYHVLLELTGLKIYSREERVALNKKLSQITGKKIQLYVLSKPEVVLTPSGNLSFDKLQEKFSKQGESLYQETQNKIVEDAL
ncbi:MAG: TIGR00341 family protein, partial [Desulfobacterales bacterium]